MAKEVESSAEDTEYKTKVIFLRKSKKGAHLYAFNRDGILGGDVGSILLDVSEVKRLIAGGTEWIKVSVIPAEESE